MSAWRDGLRVAWLTTASLGVALVVGSASWAQTETLIPRDEILRGLKKGPDRPLPEPAAAAQGRVVTYIRFASGSAQIDAASNAQIDEIAAALLDLGSDRIAIEGHTDEVGDAAYNQALSERRARSVTDALVDRGVPRQRLAARGYGESRPIAGVDGSSVEGRARHRRVEIVNLGPSASVPGEDAPLSVALRVMYGPPERQVQVAPGGTLTGAGPLAVRFVPSRRSYVYIYQRDATGISPVFPDPDVGESVNPVEGGREYRIPEAGLGYWLTGPKGPGSIHVVAALQELADPLAHLESQRGPAAGTRADLPAVFRFELPYEHR